MSDWTLGAVRARGLQLEASCKTESCRRFFVFDIDRLVDQVGADYLIADIPDLTCEACGGPLKIELAMLHPESGGD
ncbi:MAG: hypothetical protein HY245_02320 [Rhizobiales bacterium]|nr:hypothetical protein [Hyphomicrobiales bacterium]